MTDIPNRLQIAIDTEVNFAAAAYEGLPGIESTNYLWRWYAGGLARFAAPGDAQGRCRALELYVDGVLRVSGAGAGYFTSLRSSDLTTGYILKSGTSGQLVASSLSEDAVGLKASKPLTLANAVRLPWQTGHQAFQINAASALWEATAGTRFGRGVYFDGVDFRFANSVDSATMFSVFAAGGITLETTLAASVADDAIPDLAVRWGVDKTGKMTATAISISTPVTREASVTPMVLAGAAGTPAIVNCVDANMLAYGFSGTGVAESLQWAIDFDHDRIADSGAEVHVHWIPSTSATGNVGFKLYYQWTERNAVWQPATLFPTVATPAGGVAWADKYTSFLIPGTGKTYNSRLMIRLVRDSADPLDTYAGNAVLVSVGCHYSADIGQP